MFQKAHLHFTLLCAGSTIAIVLVVSLLYLRVSEINLYENRLRSFQNDAGTIASSIEASSSVSIQWLKRLETQNGYMIYIIDNGVPFLYNKLSLHTDLISQSLLDESLDAYHSALETTLSDDAPSLSGGSAFYGVWHSEFEFHSPTTHEDYHASLIDIENGRALSQIIILSSLSPTHAQIQRQRILFLWIDVSAAIVLCVFSWFFTGRLLVPLQENQKMQMQFIAAASHELRTPLSVILASSECCENASVQEQKGFFRTIRKEGIRMNSLIDDMLTLARSGMGRFPIERKPSQLDTLCLNAYEAFEPLCRSRSLTLSLTLPEDPLPRCNCDAERVAQTLSILLHNAVSYTPEGGQITLALDRKSLRPRTAVHNMAASHTSHGTVDNSFFEISVTDTGIGISDDDKKHIFERFYRAEKSRSTKEHFGLGLSIAHEIVKAHHGTITVCDNPGGGSVFVLRLPG